MSATQQSHPSLSQLTSKPSFQEHVLCRRALYFIDDKVYFRCQNAEFTELCLDSACLIRPDVNAASLLPGAIRMEDPLEDYSTILLYYTRKVLTNQSDVLRALAGIIRRFSDLVGYKFLEGLPSAALDAFIFFQADNSILHRRAGFPSWSWVGWRGGLDINIPPAKTNSASLSDWFENETWIVWYKRSPSGVTNLVWDPVADEPILAHIEKSSLLSRSGRFKSVHPLSITTIRSAPTEHISFTSSPPNYPVLQFWTVSIFYKLGEIDVFMAEGHLIGKDGSDCGQILLDGFEETMLFDSQDPLEIILLSGLSPINVMLIEWNGGIAERRGIGKLEPWAVDKGFYAGPVWKEIVLA